MEAAERLFGQPEGGVFLGNAVPATGLWAQYWPVLSCNLGNLHMGRNAI